MGSPPAAQAARTLRLCPWVYKRVASESPAWATVRAWAHPPSAFGGTELASEAVRPVSPLAPGPSTGPGARTLRLVLPAQEHCGGAWCQCHALTAAAALSFNSIIQSLYVGM